LPIEINHSEHSMLRELIIEHLFIGEALRKFWQAGVTNVEVLRSEADSFGYDLVMSRAKIVRHIQLKAMKSDGKADAQKISLTLGEKPSGCVIWVLVTENLEFKSFLWFGGEPGEPLPCIKEMAIAKHSKGTSEGKKNLRLNHREVKRRDFTELESLDDVLRKLFGAFPGVSQLAPVILSPVKPPALGA
jgi:hypothetical protein